MLNIILIGWRHRITKIFIFCGLAGLAVWALPAIAQAFLLRTNWVCSNTQTVVEALKEANESVRAIGKSQTSDNESIIMSIWVAKDGSWSIIATSQKDPSVSCVVITGDGFTRYNLSKDSI
jgi:hypothetical protein